MGMLDGKVAIVTGSGRGIGAASAQKLAAEGASVVISDIDPTPAEETLAAIRRAGGKAMAVVGDVTDPAFPSRLIWATLDSFGGLDIIVNSAGYAWDAVMQNMTDKQWQAMLDVHVTAPFHILREAFVSFMRDAAKKTAETVVRDGQEIHLGIPEHLRHQVKALIPLGRTGTSEEAAGAVLFLASPLSDFVSGAVVEVTGGGTA